MRKTKLISVMLILGVVGYLFIFLGCETVPPNPIILEDNFSTLNTDRWGDNAYPDDIQIVDDSYQGPVLLISAPDQSSIRGVWGIDRNWENYRLEFKYKISDVDNSGTVWFGARVNNFSSLYYFVISSTQIDLQRVRMDGATEVVESLLVNPPDTYSLIFGVWHEASFTFSGNTISYSIDGVEIYNITDDSQDAILFGGIGFETSFDSVYIDDVVVTDLDLE